MKLTLCLCRISRVREMRNVYKRRGHVRALGAPKDSFFDDKEIVDPNNIPDWTTMSSSDDQPLDKKLTYRHHFTMDELPSYHPDHVYEYHHKTRLFGGLQQACLLTKCTAQFELPQVTTDNIGVVEIPDQDELVQRVVMQANIWDPTKEKLPRRFSRELPGWKFKTEYGIPQHHGRKILLNNLLRLCQTLHGRYTDILMNRDFMEEAYVSAHYKLLDKSVLVRGVHEWMMTSTRPIEPFASGTSVEETVTENLPDIGPVSPVINLGHQHVYDEDVNITGYHGGYKFNNPHTVFIGTITGRPVADQQARILMNCFAHCLATAKFKYGMDVKELLEPICIQAVLTDGIQFHFACFQLNTLDFSHSEGVKNQVWFNNMQPMYNKILPKRAMLRNTKYEDYDPEVFQKFLAMYLTGADLDNTVVERSAEHVQ